MFSQNPTPIKMEENAIDPVSPLVSLNRKTNIQKNNMESNEEPATEFSFSLNPTNQCTQRRLSNDFSAGAGAGANAASRADMTFVTADPLSELVWSPHKGLSLKYADMLICRTRIHGHNLEKCEILVLQSCMLAGSNGDKEELTSKIEQSYVDINNEDEQSGKKEKGICGSTDIQRTTTSEVRRNMISCVLGDAYEAGSGNKISLSSSTKTEKQELDVAQVEPECNDYNEGTSCDPSTSKQCIVLDNPLPLLKSWDRKLEKLASVTEEKGKNKMASGFTNVPLLDKQESTAENDLRTLEHDRVCVEVGDEQSSHQNEGKLPQDEVDLVKTFPSKIRIPLSRKDKGKALVISEVNEGNLKDEDNSHGSVESCNSTGLFLGGKRPWSFEQQLDSRSKKMKRQSQENHKQDSSFMNWISNMVKGLSNSESDKIPSLALTVGPPHPEHGSHNQSFILNGKNQDSRCTNTGFEAMFKTLYCPNSSQPENKILFLDYQAGGGSAEVENDTLCKKIDEKKSKDSKGLPILPKLASENIMVLPENVNTSTAKYSNSHNIVLGIGEGQPISSDSSFPNGSSLPSEKKESYKLAHDQNKPLNSLNSKSSIIGSAWLARFSPKLTSGLTINSTLVNRNVNASIDGFTDCTKILSNTNNCVASVKDHTEVLEDASKELQIRTEDTTKSYGSKETTGQTDLKLKLKSKVTSILPSQNLEAMASVFAKRLDALRHNIPSGVADISSDAMTTCLFCGIRGHKLQDCSEITKPELEDLLKKVNLYDRVEESSYLCIRCFQLNHYAISCPNAYLRKRIHFGGSSSLVDFKKIKKLQIHEDAEKKTSTNYDYGRQVSVCDGSKPRMDTKVIVGTLKKYFSENDLDQKTSTMSPLREVILKGKKTASSFFENELKENQVTAFCNYVKRHVPAVPRGTFEAINRLRLSRTDILKWMRSPPSQFCLEGFFLRLRLRNSEEGPDTAGYYVACINGAAREQSSRIPKTPLSVDIGGNAFSAFA
ncbi:hypothetical protein GIB67_027167 [Kingdonia uniflora]|uniref:Plus3 domain-containing protein n=1 Tax=Kingdonia uniflora TaxID=39325 RepID=A0A7J7P2K9_9MAGN|nr:hypothetical protein GIB67_027167 [Kingdonia uniflora]